MLEETTILWLTRNICINDDLLWACRTSGARFRACCPSCTSFASRNPCAKCVTFPVGSLINWLVGRIDGLLVNEFPGGVTFILHPCLGRNVRTRT